MQIILPAYTARTNLELVFSRRTYQNTPDISLPTSRGGKSGQPRPHCCCPLDRAAIVQREDASLRVADGIHQLLENFATAKKTRQLNLQRVERPCSDGAEGWDRCVKMDQQS